MSSYTMSLLYNNTTTSVLWLNVATRTNVIFVSRNDSSLNFYFPVFVALCDAATGQPVSCPSWTLNNQDNSASYALGGYLYKPSPTNGTVPRKVFTVEFYLQPIISNNTIAAFDLVSQPVAALRVLKVADNSHTVQATFTGSTSLVSIDLGAFGKYYLTDWPTGDINYGLPPINIDNQNFACNFTTSPSSSTSLVTNKNINNLVNNKGITNFAASNLASAVAVNNLVIAQAEPACNCPAGLICSVDENQPAATVSYCREPDCRDIGCSTSAGFECRHVGLNNYQCVYNPILACQGVCGGICPGSCPQGQTCVVNDQGLYSCVPVAAPPATSSRWLLYVLIILLVMILVFAIIWIVLARKKRSSRQAMTSEGTNVTT